MRVKLQHVLLALLCIFHVSINIIWLHQNKAPLPWDQAGHTRLAIEYLNHFSPTDNNPDKNFLSISSYYPPLTHILSATTMGVIGVNADTAAIVISFYFMASLVGVYLLVSSLSKNESIGLLAALIFSLFPIVYDNSRWFLLEIPLITWLIFSWLLLIKTKYFTKWLPTFGYAICIIGVLLTKWSGIIFVLAPSLFTLGGAIKSDKLQLALKNIFVASIFILAFTLPWYTTNLTRLLEIGSLAAKGEITDPQQLLSFENIFFYLNAFFNFQVSFWPMWVVIGSVVNFVSRKRLSSYHHVIMTTIIFSYLVFTFISNKDIRYTLPLLVPLAGITAYELWHLSQYKKALGRIVTTITVVFLFSQYIYLSFGLLPKFQKAINFGPFGWIDYINTGDVVVKHPEPDLSPNKDLLKSLEMRQPTTAKRILIGIDQPETNPSTLDLEIIANQYKNINLEAPFTRTSFNNETEIRSYLAGFDYLVIPTGEVGPDAVRHKIALQQIRDYTISNRGNLYQELEHFKLRNRPGEILIMQPISD